VAGHLASGGGTTHTSALHRFYFGRWLFSGKSTSQVECFCDGVDRLRTVDGVGTPSLSRKSETPCLILFLLTLLTVSTAPVHWGTMAFSIDRPLRSAA
jgi:hypothetical protein